jgi:acyl-coenzyme A thioesterase PaaI-like protein
LSSATKRPLIGRPEALRDDRAARRTEPMTFANHEDWHRLSQAIRRQVEACVELDASPDLVRQLADRAVALAEELEASAPGKRFELVESGWDGTGTMNYLPFSPIMGRLNPASYGLEIHQDGDRAVGEVTLLEPAEGSVGLAHGGVISGIWDEVLAAANAIQKTGGPTGSLTIRYHRPTPLYEPLRYSARVEQIEERKVLVSGECTLRDEVLTSAEGIFIRLRRTGIDWHKHDSKSPAG